MTSQSNAETVRNLLESAPPKLATPLAKPWHYRRNGRYYLRFRTQGRPFLTFTVSLRTSDRSTAMEISTNIQRALAYFHLDKPEATWEELKVRLMVIADESLAIAHGNLGSDYAHSEFYQEMYFALREVSKQGNLSLDQHRALATGQSIMAAANARIEGRPEALVKVIDRLNQDGDRNSQGGVNPSLSVGAPQDPLSWNELSELYMVERSINLKEDSRKSAMTAHRTIASAFEAIGLADLRGHTREDLIALRTKLLEGRQASTVNNLLSQLGAVLVWAVSTDKLTKQYTDKLKITKGADSKREAFTREQVLTLMAQANALPVASWERWALSLLAITGARVGEVSFLTKADIKQVYGLWCIDINEDADGKSIKTKHSKRLVPLVDGALGFDLSAFLQAVNTNALPSDHGVKPEKASKVLGQLIKQTLGDDLGEHRTLHSLRHHMAASMKAAGVELQYAQAVTGHASRTITYDTYGGGIPVQKKYEAIRKALEEGAVQ